jgi:dihydrolipoamide dehydrogenase
MTYPYQLVIIGSGAGGKDAAILGARAGLRVLLVEKESLGGTSFHRGCHAMRALRACAMNHQTAGANRRTSLPAADPEIDWAHWLNIQRRVSARLTKELSWVLEDLGVQVRFGAGELLDRNTVEISDPYGSKEKVSAENIIIATGSRPSFAGEDAPAILNSDQMLKNTAISNHLLIIGGGYIGCEFASIYAALGSQVSLVEQQKNLLPGWDEVAGAHLREVLQQSAQPSLAHNASFLAAQVSPEASGTDCSRRSGIPATGFFAAPLVSPAPLSRKRLGDWPVSLWNTRLKCVRDWNPTA